MPKPAHAPKWLVEECTIIATPASRMTNQGGRQVSPALFAIEHKIPDFKVLILDDKTITINGDGHVFHVEYSNLSSWKEGQPPPERVIPPSWVRVGVKMRWQGQGAPALRSTSPVTIEGGHDGVVSITGIFTRHLEVNLTGVVGVFRIDLTTRFERDWAVATDNHDPRVKIAPFIAPRRRIRPADVNGNQIGDVSYLVVRVDAHLGTFVAAPMLGDGVIGRDMVFGLWNTAVAWCIAPDDSSRERIQVGMVLHNGQGEFEVAHVNDLTGEISLRGVHEVKIQKGQAGWHLVPPKEGEAPKKKPRSRFARALD